MNYLESAVVLKKLIAKTNHKMLQLNSKGLVEQNMMVIRTNFGNEVEVKMDAFTNEFVNRQLGQYESEAFVITDLVSTVQNGHELTYFLYKGYHHLFHQGLVFFQLVNKETLKPIGNLDFSNIEDNIFYKIDTPDFEESSCNAIETAENTAKNPCIAFLIGNMNEERMLFDINRLIYETANNVQKHTNRHFKIHLQVTKFGGKPSAEFLNEIEEIKKSIDKYIKPEYPNSTFIFDLEN